MDAQAMIPLNPRDYLVLFSLAAEDRHGYGIVQDIEHESAGRVRVDPANLYRSIKRMIASGLLEEADEREPAETGDQRRRYYRITPFGREVAKLEALRLARLTDAARARRLLTDAETMP
jgi:DNA-binding PadR family transcriptional regulator